MKTLRCISAIALIIALALLIGCSKSYFFNFTTESDLERYDGTFYTFSNPDGTIFFFEDGLFVQNSWVGVPHLYSGNFTVTIMFELDATQADPGQVAFHFSTQHGLWGADWTGGIDLNGLGGTPYGYYYVYYDPDYSGNVYVETSMPIVAPVHLDGLNEMEIVKQGLHLDFILNGFTIGSGLNIIGSSTDFFCPHFYACQNPGMTTVYFESIRVDYEADRLLLP